MLATENKGMLLSDLHSSSGPCTSALAESVHVPDSYIVRVRCACAKQLQATDLAMVRLPDTAAIYPLLCHSRDCVFTQLFFTSV